MSNLAPSDGIVQAEALEFNNPVSESSLAQIGGLANYLLYVALPVGAIFPSVLNPTQMLAYNQGPSTSFVPCDGQSYPGSVFASVFGSSVVPDLRGLFIRGLNNFQTSQGVRSDGYKNDYDASGLYAAGQLSLDTVGPHNHPVTAALVSSGGADGGSGRGELSQNNATTTSNNSGLETAPKNMSLFYYIRIN
jgi:hypothetical protein